VFRWMMGALTLLALAAPARAYPTALITVPTAGIQPFKGYHLGLAAALQRTGSESPLAMASLAVGLTPWFPLTETLSAGALEAGVDLYYPFPFENGLYPARGLTSATGPTLAQPHLKLGLLQETDWLPGLAAGVYGIALPDWQNSANLVHLSLSRTVTIAGIDLGQWTLAGYHGNPGVLRGPTNEDASNGFMLGFFRNLPYDLYVMADYTSGQHRTGGLNLALGWAINERLSLTVGGFTANAGEGEDKALMLLDYVDELTF
jgi:hypothetical protein